MPPKGLSFQHCMISALDPGGIACRISVMAFRMKRGHALSPPPGLLKSLRTGSAQSARKTPPNETPTPRRLTHPAHRPAPTAPPPPHTPPHPPPPPNPPHSLPPP